MWQTINIRPDLSGTALSDLKQWLGISILDEDDQLVSLLEASAEMCDAFCRQTPIDTTFDEAIPPEQGEYQLQSRPVRSIISLDKIPQQGFKEPLAASAYTIVTDAEDITRVQLHEDVDARVIVVRSSCGMAANWESLARPLRQGIIRLASFYYRDRGETSGTTVPASVAALWRPWQLLRLQ